MSRGSDPQANSMPTAPEADTSHADIGIVCALPIEMGAFLAHCDRVRKYVGAQFVFRGGRYGTDKYDGGIRVAVVESGTGFARARRAAFALLDAHSPKWVLSCGFAGALVPSMRVGDIVVADSIVDTHGQSLAIDVSFPPDPDRGIHAGRLLTTDAIVRLVQEKKEMGQRYSAVAVDMETLAVAQVCRETGTRFLAIRAISDDLSNDLPAEVLSLLGPTGTTRFGAAMGAIINRPHSVREMWQLRKAAHFAAGRLATFLDGVVTQLYNAMH